MIIDTHEAVERIVEAGASKKMAEAIVKTLNSSSDNLATKQDIRELKSEIKEVRSEIQVLEVTLRSEIAGVRSEVAQLRTEFSYMKWLQYSILALLLAPMVAQFVALYLK